MPCPESLPFHHIISSKGVRTFLTNCPVIRSPLYSSIQIPTVFRKAFEYRTSSLCIRGTCSLYELVGEHVYLYTLVGDAVMVGEHVDVYALVGRTPRSGNGRSGNARSEKTRGAHPFQCIMCVHMVFEQNFVFPFFLFHSHWYFYSPSFHPNNSPNCPTPFFFKMHA